MTKWSALPIYTRLAITIWIALLAGVFGRVAAQGTSSQTVLPVYLEGGQRWANGKSLYAAMPEKLDVYRNPPVMAAVTVPFTWLPPYVTAMLWRTFFICLYLLGLFRFLRDVAPSLAPIRRSIFFISSAVLVLNAFNNAQLNLLIIAAVLLGVAAAARGSWWASAFWLTVAAQVKIYPLALVGLACVAFPIKMIWRSGLLLLLGLALPFLLGNPHYAMEQYRDFAEALRSDDRTDDPIERAPRNWTIVPRAFADMVVPRSVAIPISAVVGVLFSVAVRLIPKEQRLLFAFCSGTIWMVLFGPGAEMNTYSILAPVAAWLICRESSDLWAWLGSALLLAAVIRGGLPPDPNTGMVALQPFGATALMGSLVCWATVVVAAKPYCGLPNLNNINDLPPSSSL
jgi:hypothetical protein